MKYAIDSIQFKKQTAKTKLVDKAVWNKAG